MVVANNERIDGLTVEEYKLRVSGTMEIEESVAALLRLDGRVVFIGVGRTGEASFKANEEEGNAVRKDVITVESLLPLTGEAREQAISFMRDPAQNVMMMVPYVDQETGEMHMPKQPVAPGPIEQAIAEDVFAMGTEEPVAQVEIPKVDITEMTAEEVAETLAAMQRGEVEVTVDHGPGEEVARYRQQRDVMSQIAEGTANVLEALERMGDDEETDDDDSDDAWPDPREFEADETDEAAPAAAPREHRDGDGPGFVSVPYADLLEVGPASPHGASLGGQVVGHVEEYR